MKTLIKIAIAAVMITAGTALKGQDYPKEYLGLPGDNLNLYAVMNTFQESRNLRAFERSLNDPDNRINNLDLNGDNLVDYITVSDNVNGNVHYIVLRVAISRKESQDVAVFTVQQLNNGQIYVQLTGDEALYGKNYIIEPADQILLADWPLVRNVLRSNYITWQSDWYWGYYPDYWTPWRPFYWHYYYGYNNYWNDYYYTCYHRSYAHNDIYWNEHYYNGHRVYSQEVTHNVHSGYYSSTYSHPEKRQEGEEQYRNRYPEMGRRGSYSTYTGSTSGTNNNSTSTGRRSSGSETSSRNNTETNIVRAEKEQRTLRDENTTRRMASDVTRSTFNNSVSDQNGRSETRQSTVVTSRPETRTDQSQAISSGRTESRPVQSQNVSSSRSEYRPEQNQSVSSARQESRPIQSQNVSSARTESRPEQSQAVSQSRSQVQTRNESVSSERRSSGEEKQVKNNTGSENEKKSESVSASRRK
jgi:hypothetical protein